jgi:hypothetical protein
VNIEVGRVQLLYARKLIGIMVFVKAESLIAPQNATKRRTEGL